MIEKINKKILTSPKLIVFMSTVVLIFCIVSGFLLSNLLFHREPEEIAAKEILSPFSSSEENQLPEGNTVEEDARPKVMYTDIKGSVKEPGIYSFSSEERVYDVLKRAGGLLEEADSDRINFSAKIEDQQVLYIPAVGEEPPEHLNQSASPEGKQSTADTEPSKININTASPSELQQIPGIGSVKAQEIIRFREENGSFQKVEDLQEISGIGEKTVEKLKNFVTIK
ncbi:helix-hairpin-helix domain-containing protein [Enterococcus faecium]|uniref:ComEA protein n=2 Tax=Enterococcus TaxID=1350 RepID=A0A828ZQP9_ENTFC|nr:MULTISPECIES: helix-hairpin-helix domain-containing protein [Enterococcus]EEI60547.1 comEA protein [Enterococcus faecium TX1330]EEV50574.1 competence protein ComEA [Enterococcus faecium 1,141,733]EEV59070.1 competence protein ComEA [Enterococcus faecium Com12]EFF61984.1 comEA protein [Enterococcus faecium PC4.1]EJV42352.1 comEA protein [Enterococcus faecium TX1337RF]ELB02803.1 comEA protein [Enterococcus faecium EnGen0003]ELB52371.1 comEA protein [Enterococcus faecium EnGen0038]ELB57129.